MATQAISISSSPSIKTDSAPIGIFDSGVGGLSVYLHLKQQLPDEQYLYYADTLNVPYGPRSSAEIKELTLIAVDWLVQSGCKLIVIACNSASAHALQLARHKYPHIPIVGLVPALKPAVLNSNSKSVAVLATKATLDGELLNTVISDYALPAQVNVVKWFDPNLVPWVEAGMPIQSETPERLKAQLKNFAQQKVDHLVLGCTHYPFFREFVMSQIADENLGIKVVDSGAAIAARVKTLLQQSQSLAASKQVEASNESLYIGHSDQERDDLSLAQCKLSFFVSDPKADLAEVSKLVNRLIHR